MKKILILLFTTLVFAAAGCKKNEQAGAGADNNSDNNSASLIIGLDDSFPPMGFRDENNEIVGFDIDLAREVAKKLNMKLVVQPIDWASKELELNNGKISCIWNGLSVSPAREEAMTLSKPYIANRMIIITKNDSTLSSKADLEGKTVGLQTGSTAVAALEKDPINAKVKQATYENNVLALQDLEIGRIDAVIMDEVVAKYITTKKPGIYKVLNDSFNEEFYAIAFKKGNVELKDKVEQAISQLIAEGKATEISKKWFNDDILVK